MTAAPALAVTGATGGVGGRVAARLAGRGVATRLVVRDAARAPRLPGATPVIASGYADTEAMRRALDGAETLFLVPGSESADRIAEHRSAVDAAVAAGVRRIVYLSFVAAAPDATFTFVRDHWHTEEHVRATGLGFTFVRMNLYLDFLAGMVGADGVIAGPAGDGRAACVTRDDVADVCAAVLAGEGHEGRTYDVTGPEALSLAEVAAELSRAAGRRIAYRDQTLEEAYATRAGYGAPPWEVEGWVTTYAAIAAGELAAVADTVERLTGHPPASLREFLAANPSALEPLRG